MVGDGGLTDRWPGVHGLVGLGLQGVDRLFAGEQEQGEPERQGEAHERVQLPGPREHERQQRERDADA